MHLYICVPTLQYFMQFVTVGNCTHTNDTGELHSLQKQIHKSLTHLGKHTVT